MSANLKKAAAGLTVVVVVVWLWPERAETWRIANAPAGSGPIVCFGDSLTRGHGAPPEASYPAVLEDLLGRETVNLGRDGETTEAAVERFDEALELEPGVVIFTLGGNDIIRRVPIEVTLDSMRTLFRRAIESGAVAVFLSIDPPFVGEKRMNRVKDLCRDLGVLYVGEILDGMWGRSSLMSDRIHPNAAGYELMAERVRKAIGRVL